MHSGDSACAIPPPTLSGEVIATIEAHTRQLAEALDVRGLLNVQYAVKDGQVFVIEANPRASRTVPFVSKATGVPLAKVAARVMLGATLAELRGEGLLRPPATGGHVAVKEAVLPFDRFPDVDTILGPEMRSTGEVMGIDRSFGLAFAKSQAAAGNLLPAAGTVFFSLADRDKRAGPRRGPALRRAGLHHRGDGRAPPRCSRPKGSRSGRPSRRWGRAAESTRSISSPRARSTSWSTRRVAAVRVPTERTSAVPRPVTTCRASPPSRPRSRPPAGSPRGPRRSRRCVRCRSTTATRSSGSGSDGAPVATDRICRITLGDLELANPIVAASGTFGHGDEVARLCDPSRLGAVTTKSQAAFEWAGNPPPRLHPATAGMVNAVGLQGHGVAHWVAHDLPPLRARGATVIASIWGHTVDDYAAAAALLAPAVGELAAVEVNLSCPNTKHDSVIFAHEADATAEVVRAVAQTDARAVPVLAKLSAGVGDLPVIAGAALDAGADGLTLVNTVRAFLVDPEARRPVLGSSGGGLSGPAIAPIALRAVHDVQPRPSGRPDHRHRRRQHRRRRGPDAPGRCDRSRGRHGDLPGAAGDPSDPRRARALVRQARRRPGRVPHGCAAVGRGVSPEAVEARVRDRLVLGLDVGGLEQALPLARRLAPWFATAKVGFELYAEAGPAAFDAVHEAGLRVFADLKLHDIPNTVGRAARTLGRRGVDFLNFHAAGGVDMLRAGVDGLREGAAASGHAAPIALGVTVLTSEVDTSQFASRLDAAKESGCDGVVCSAFEIGDARAGGLRTMVPGLRLAGSDANDQARVATPGDATARGADWLVIGRTVTAAEDPEAAAAQVSAEVAVALDA